MTVLSSRTGIPAARSCLVRLKTQALAASCTFSVAGWFFMPKTTSWESEESGEADSCRGGGAVDGEGLP